jgi:hypothetical protein
MYYKVGSDWLTEEPETFGGQKSKVEAVMDDRTYFVQIAAKQMSRSQNWNDRDIAEICQKFSAGEITEDEAIAAWVAYEEDRSARITRNEKRFAWWYAEQNAKTQRISDEMQPRDDGVAIWGHRDRD